MPKKIVRVTTLNRLLAEWDERLKFCVLESEKYRRATYARREWTTRSGAVARCINELRELLT